MWTLCRGIRNSGKCCDSYKWDGFVNIFSVDLGIGKMFYNLLERDKILSVSFYYWNREKPDPHYLGCRWCVPVFFCVHV